MPTSISRRQFLVGAAATTASLSIGNISLASKSNPKAKILSTKVISKQSQYYNGWPTLTRRKNGELLVVWSGGRERHVCPFGRVDMMRSNDNGETWTWPRTLIDGAIDDRDAGVLETSKGTLLVTTFTSLAYERQLKAMQLKVEQPGAQLSPDLERWMSVHLRLTAEQRQTEKDLYMIRSTDGGINWSARYLVPLNSPHGPVQLSDGRLLYAGKEVTTTEQQRIGVCESRDDGKSWQWITEIPMRDGDQIKNYHELHAVEASNGHIIIHIRNHNKNNFHETLQSTSTDGGNTWNEPYSIGVWGLPSHLLRLKDGQLLMTYGYRREPFGNQARISKDNGKTWSEPLTISADGINGDLGYPSTVELNEGTLLTVWYEQMQVGNPAVLRQTKWKLKG